MKTLWNTLAVLAIANLLALGGLVGWLVTGDRLNMDRLRAIRAMMAVTLTDERAAQEAAAAKATADEAAAAEKARLAESPESAAEKLDSQRASDDAARQLNVRLRREIEDLRRQLLAERETLDRDKAEFSAMTAAFERATRQERERLENEQFRQALAALESQKPRDAQQVLAQMLDNGQTEQALNYLGAMGERPRSRVIAEFIKADAKLAAGLLERLRERGAAGVAGAATPTTPPGATPGADAQANGP